MRGRKDWAPGAGVDGGVETIRADRPPTNVIQRDRLVACLLAEARSHGVVVRHETDVTGVRWEGETAVLSLSPCGEECAAEEPEAEGAGAGAEAARTEEVAAPFVVASDGARRTVALAMEAEDAARRWAPPWDRFRIVKYADTSVRVYKTVPFRPPADWRGDINYSARTAAANCDPPPLELGEQPPYHLCRCWEEPFPVLASCSDPRARRLPGQLTRCRRSMARTAASC